MNNLIVQAENLEFLKSLPDNYCRLIYIDPPFNTGIKQKRQRISVVSDIDGDRIGFGGYKYTTEKHESPSYEDSFDDFLGFLKPRLLEVKRILTEDGSLFFHLDYREIHYAKVMLDEIFGRESFINEIIWSYDYGAKSKTRWPAKHDTILWYAKDCKKYIFNYEEIDRIPYMAPDLVGPEKAARGKIPTDVWFMTIVPTNSKEKTGYPTQKPMRLLNRIIKVHSMPRDIVMDFFAGSGTTGMSAGLLGRRFIMVDKQIAAIETMEKRLLAYNPIVIKDGTDEQPKVD